MGNLIEKNNKFVIIDVTMKNNSREKIEPNFSRFHLMNKNINRVNTIIMIIHLLIWEKVLR